MRKKQNFQWEHLSLGTCYYPEHWDKKLRKWSNRLIEVRSVCPHFGIMEQQSGANGWNTRM